MMKVQADKASVLVDRVGGLMAVTPLVDRSLEGYKAWVRGIGVAISGKPPKQDMSEADWQASWRTYWSFMDALIVGREGSD